MSDLTQMPDHLHQMFVLIQLFERLHDHFESFEEELGVHAMPRWLETTLSSIAPPPITTLDRAQLESLPFSSSLLLHHNRMEDTCPICKDSFVVGRSVTQLPCDHYFCEPFVLDSGWTEAARAPSAASS